MPELWIVSLVKKQIEVYTEPHRHEYLTRLANPLTGRFCTAARLVLVLDTRPRMA